MKICADDVIIFLENQRDSIPKITKTKEILKIEECKMKL